MYCGNCGTQVEEDSVYCRHCGRKVGGGAENPNTPPTGLYYAEDKSSAGGAALGFFFPVAGFILWLVWQDKYRKRATSCGKGALAGVIVSAVIVFITFIIMLAMM